MNQYEEYMQEPQQPYNEVPVQAGIQEVNERQSYSMLDNNTSPELVRELINNGDFLERVAHLLKGEIWSESRNRWIQITKPYGNEEFINDVLLILHTHTGQEVILSNLEDDDVHNITYDIVNRIIELIYYKGKEQGIDRARRSEIVSIINNQVYLALRRAYKQGEKDFLGRSVTHRENIVNSEKVRNKRTGLFKDFLNKGGLA